MNAPNEQIKLTFSDYVPPSDGPDQKDHIPESSGLQNSVLEFRIGGMHCANCAISIEKALDHLPGVREANVSFAMQNARVNIDPASNPRVAEDISRTISSLGYQSLESEKPAASEGPVSTSMILSIVLAALFILNMGLSFFGLFVLPLGFIVLAATVAQFYLGARFYKNAWAALQHGDFTMDSLIAIGTSAAYGLSMAHIPWSEILTAPSLLIVPYTMHNYFEASILVICFVYLGQFLEQRVTAKARQKLYDLSRFLDQDVNVDEDGVLRRVPASTLVAGQIVVIEAGTRIPIDGIIVNGSSDIDESLLTGEPMPVLRTKGDMVYAGTLNVTKVLRIEVQKTGDATRIGFIGQLVQQAASSKPPIAKKIDRICRIFVPTVLGVAGITFVLWAGYDLSHSLGLSRALINAVSVLVIACPCALGLATPMVVIASIGLAAREGILIKNAAVLENLHDINHVVLDKTGTLTQGKPSVTDIVPLANDSHTILRFAASATAQSRHPISQAISKFAAQQNISLLKPFSVQEIPGQGLIAEFHNNKTVSSNPLDPPETVKHFVLVGNRRLLNAQNFDLTATQSRAGELALDGKSLIYVGIANSASVRSAAEKDQAVMGLIALQDQLRPSSADVIAHLKERNLKIILLTGDTKQSAERVAQTIGIDDVQADILPEEKAGRVYSLTQRGRHVLMLGDGINDAAALANAGIGIAVAGGSDLAMDAADVGFMRSDPAQLLRLFELSDLFRRKIKENLWWAFGFNIVGIPLAAAGFLHPAFAGAAMACSSLLVVGNAVSIMRAKPSPEA